MGEKSLGPANSRSVASLLQARKDIDRARSIIYSKALAANGPKRLRHEAALRHIDLAIAEVDHKLTSCNRGS